MIRIITTGTMKFYQAKAEEAGKVPGLEYELQEARKDVVMWRGQSDDYLLQRNQERERTAQLTGELRELQARFDNQQADFDRQLDSARKPIEELFTDLLDRLNHPAQGAEVRKEVALRVLETCVQNMTEEDHNSPMGLILRVITDTEKPERDAVAT